MKTEQLIDLLISQGKISREELDRQIQERRNESPLQEMKAATDKLKTPSKLYEELLSKEETSLFDLQQAKINELKDACTNAIYDGFVSGAYSYGFNAHDQVNFTQQLLVIVAGDTSPISWKTKDDGVVDLTAAEFQQVINDAKAHKLLMQEKFWVLELEVLGAESKEAVDAVKW